MNTINQNHLKSDLLHKVMNLMPKNTNIKRNTKLPVIFLIMWINFINITSHFSFFSRFTIPLPWLHSKYLYTGIKTLKLITDTNNKFDFSFVPESWVFWSRAWSIASFIWENMQFFFNFILQLPKIMKEISLSFSISVLPNKWRKYVWLLVYKHQVLRMFQKQNQKHLHWVN